MGAAVFTYKALDGAGVPSKGELKAGSKDILPVQVALASKTRPTNVRWLAVDEESKAGRMVERPTRADIPLAVQEQLIVELYSK